MRNAAFAAATTRLPPSPAIAAGIDAVAWVDPDGEAETISLSDAARRIGGGAVPLLCHGPALARRIGLRHFPALDVLELFAFVRPARFAVPTVRGLAASLLLPTPTSLTTEASTLFAVARALLAELTASPRENAVELASSMARAGWAWGEAVQLALGVGNVGAGERPVGDGLRVWQRLKDWEEVAPWPPAESWPVEPVEARARLVRLLGSNAEPRPQQMAYASHAAAAFEPRDRAGEPRIVIAEAGTGIGKTLGYIAPATVWAQKNRGTVWISTFTRNLQRQLDAELDHAYPNLREKLRKVVVRKGRENIFCLLNFEDAVERLPLAGAAATTALGLVARWATATRDGDMVGGDFPAWLAGLFPAEITAELTDTHGECIYAACRHFRRCFIERAIRRARRAEIVVANHALVLTRAARGAEEVGQPLRYVFDEAHHLFDAADSAFAWHLSGLQTAELRRWLRGSDDVGRSRRRNLRDRAGDLVEGNPGSRDAMDAVIEAARALPGPGWRQRLASAAPIGAVERFLSVVREQVHARNADGDPAYSLEAPLRPAIPGLEQTADSLHIALDRFRAPLTTVIRSLADRLDAEAASLDSAIRQRIEGVCRSLERRALLPIVGWQAMLRSLTTGTPAEFIDWLGIERGESGERDIGFFRHWVDPTRPFAEMVLQPAHGVLLTSATLRDCSRSDGDDWVFAEQRTGVRHLATLPILSAQTSPFDYAHRTSVLVVTDIDRNNPRQIAAAYRELFFAAGGGGLGLFTAIGRLRAVYRLVGADLEAAGIPLLAQHVDALDTGTLIDIFRAEEDSCLLGTDAVRDGIDVPGRALRLIVFDRIPWPRPTLLHRARRDAFGGHDYDERLTRLKLKQAFGRLIRKAEDVGAFVMLDRALPSRLTSAFPDGVPVRRVGLAEAIEEVRAICAGEQPAGSGRRSRL